MFYTRGISTFHLCLFSANCFDLKGIRRLFVKPFETNFNVILQQTISTKFPNGFIY